MNKKSVLTVLSVLVLLSLISCTQSQRTVEVPPPNNGQIPPVVPEQSTQGATKEVTIEMREWQFQQSDVQINKGDHVRLRITSTSGTHGIMFPDLGISTNRIGPGEEQIIEFDATQDGTFTYFCNVPCGSGHQNMRGTLVVEP